MEVFHSYICCLNSLLSVCKGLGSSAMNEMNILMILEKLKRIQQLESQKDMINWVLQVSNARDNFS